MTAPAIEDLVADLRGIIADCTDPAAITARVAERCRPLADDQSWIEPEFYAGGGEQGFAVTVLHEEADQGLFIETVCWLPGRGVAPHDHQTWAVIVGLDGEERNTNWRRLDDGRKPGYAEIERQEDIVARCGDVIRLLPDAIHSVHNEGSARSLSLHIYGRNLATVARFEFNPVTKTQCPCPERSRKK